MPINSFISVDPRANVAVRMGRESSMKNQDLKCKHVLYDFVVKRQFLQWCKISCKKLQMTNADK